MRPVPVFPQKNAGSRFAVETALLTGASHASIRVVLITPEIQRLVAEGSGPIRNVCVVDVGAIGRWVHEAGTPAAAPAIWECLAEATKRSERSFVWVAAVPGDLPPVFGTAELEQSVRALHALGVSKIIRSDESVTSLLSNERPIARHGITVVSAFVTQYPELLYVLEAARTLLDIATGIAHVDDGLAGDGQSGAEPLFIPRIQAASRPDPNDRRGRPLAGNRAPDQLEGLERFFIDEFLGDATPSMLPQDTLEKLSVNRVAIDRRVKSILQNTPDQVARAELQQALPPPRTPITSPGAIPIVTIPFDTGDNGKIHRGRGQPRVTLGTHVEVGIPADGATAVLLSKLVQAHPKLWIAPRALDLLGFMADRKIDLPERIIDPAHCAFALDPDRIEDVISRCNAASEIPKSAHDWIWDVKRKAPPPADPDDLGKVAAVLGRVVDELRSEAAKRHLSQLVEDDIAPTIPVLAAMERRGAWIRDSNQVAASRAHVQSEMSRLEAIFIGMLGNVDPYEARPGTLVAAVARQGIVLPKDYVFSGNDSANTLERLGLRDRRIGALLQARALADISKWLARVEGSGERLRGHHIPLASGRWGMNAWPLQGLPKHSQHAHHLRSLLGVPTGKCLLAADFSSFELRLIAGLSRDPLLLVAAGKPDAIGHLADVFFDQTNDPKERAKYRSDMKSHIHPLNYGMEEWGFIRSQVSRSVSDARGCYETLRDDLPELFRWRERTAKSGKAQTTGGWQRTPQAASRKAKENKTVSTTVQGLAADILRWCLRELNRTLPSMGAELVFQNHDEVYVAVDSENVGRVDDELRDVLETRVLASGLVPPDIKLFARVKEGITWADLA